MLAADGVRVITGYLGHSDMKVREAAVCALNVISLETEGKKDVLQHSLSGLAELAHSSKETPYLHETCVQLCRCASELPAFRFAFARHTINSIWLLEKVYGTTALAAVSPLLREKETLETRAQAAKAMAFFLTKKDPAEGDLIRVPPVTPLVHIQVPVMFAIEECVDSLHDLLSLLKDAPDSAFECLEALTEYEKPRLELELILDMGFATVDKPNDLARVKQMLTK